MAPRGHRADWPKIESDYVNGFEEAGELIWPTLDDLCHQYKVSPRQIRRRSKRDGWPAQRAAYHHVAAAELYRRKLTRLVKRAGAVDERALTLAEDILAAVRAEPGMLLGDLALAALAAKRAHELARAVLGIPEVGEAQKSAQQAASEAPDPLQALSRKLLVLDAPSFERAVLALAAVARPARNGGNGNGVTLLPALPAGEWSRPDHE